MQTLLQRGSWWSSLLEASSWEETKEIQQQGKKKTTTTTQQDLGSDSGEETKIRATGMKGKESIASTSTSNWHKGIPN